MASDAEALRTHVVRAGHDQLRASVVDVLQRGRQAKSATRSTFNVYDALK
jgi:hypothetical protein